MSGVQAGVILVCAGLALVTGGLAAKVIRLQGLLDDAPGQVAVAVSKPALRTEIQSETDRTVATEASPNVAEMSVDDLPNVSVAFSAGNIPRKKKCGAAVADNGGGPTPLACPCAITQEEDKGVEIPSPIAEAEYLAALRASAERAASEGRSPNGVPDFTGRIAREQDGDAGIAPEQALNEPAPEPVELKPDPLPSAMAATQPKFAPDDL